MAAPAATGVDGGFGARRRVILLSGDNMKTIATHCEHNRLRSNGAVAAMMKGGRIKTNSQQRICPWGGGTRCYEGPSTNNVCSEGEGWVKEELNFEDKQ